MRCAAWCAFQRQPRDEHDPQSVTLMRLLVFNAGSSSLKFDLMEVPVDGPARPLKAGAFVDTADGSGALALQTAEAAPPVSAPIRTLAAAADFVLAWLSQESAHGRDLAGIPIAALNLRRHGGERFRAIQG